ncbi:MAG: CPBP family intramembrane metalloprotease [Clostridiaceae bacterium]|nr:CPBP family intramembrane metalloprotease [Clostridiaceae bacterium]
MANNRNIESSAFETPKLFETGLLFSVVAFLLLFIGTIVQKRNFTTGILITEFVIILLPPILLLWIRKYDIPRMLRLNRVSFLNLFIIFSMMLFSLWIVTIINLFNLWLLKTIFGRVLVPQLPLNENSVLINILLVGGSAGICEEVMFRGVIQRSFERFGAFLSIFITSLLFGLFHMDFQKLLGTFLLGMLIGFIVYRTNSLYAGMFAHFTNNTLAVLISSLSEKVPGVTEMQANNDYVNSYFNMLESMPSPQLAMVVFIWIMSALFCGAALAGLMWAFVRNTSSNREKISHTRTEKILPAILAFLPGAIAIVVVYVSTAYALSGLR